MTNKRTKPQLIADPVQDQEDRLAVPAEVAVLPVRDTVLFPQAAQPLTIGRESSIQLVNLLRAEEILAVIAQKDGRAESPGPADLYNIGTLAVVHKVIRMPNQSLFIFVHGLQRIRQEIIRHYTREAGVRNLERNIASICRKQVRRIAETGEMLLVVDRDVVREVLGAPEILAETEIAGRTERPGVAVGLAWTPEGGDILFVEANQMPGKRGLIMTGHLGQVMQESMQAALTWVRSNTERWGLPPDYFENREIHLHVPAGAIPKDGPSAGVTMATALASLLTRRHVRPQVAMTGEITLSGLVLPVGGTKEKVLAAKRAGITEIILPKENEPELDDLPDDVRKTLIFHPVEALEEVLSIALLSRDAKAVEHLLGTTR